MSSEPTCGEQAEWARVISIHGMQTRKGVVTCERPAGHSPPHRAVDTSLSNASSGVCEWGMP